MTIREEFEKVCSSLLRELGELSVDVALLQETVSRARTRVGAGEPAGNTPALCRADFAACAAKVHARIAQYDALQNLAYFSEEGAA
jgi:hypothetical protein